MAKKELLELQNSEHDTETTCKKKVGTYGYDLDNTIWRRLAVDASGNLKITNAGNMTIGGYYLDMTEIATPAAPDPNHGIWLTKDDGSGESAPYFLSDAGIEYSMIGGGGGATVLDALTDVAIASLADGQVLRYDGVADNIWKNAQLAHSDLSGIGSNTHDEIDTAITNSVAHIADTSDPHQTTWAQIDKTVSDLADITTKSHTSLSDIGTNTHAQVDTHLAAVAPHSGHVDTTGDETIAGIKTLTSFPILPSSTPTTAYQAVHKEYADSLAAGFTFKEATDVATTAVLPACTYDNGTLGVGATLTADADGALGDLDGYTVQANDRILVKDQAAQEHNGVYVCTAVGDGDNPFILTRVTDYDTSAEITQGTAFLVLNGTANGATQYALSTAGTVTVGTTDLVFIQISKPTAYSAGDGLDLTGSEFSTDIKVNDGLIIDTSELTISYDNSSIGIVDNKLAVKATGITNAMLAGSIADSKLSQITTASKVSSTAIDGIAALVQGDLIYGSGTDTLALLNKSATATRYLSNTGTSNNPAWAQVNLANGVTGELPDTNLATISTVSKVNWAAVNKTGSILDDIGDVDVGAATDGQVLTWDTDTSTWLPSTVSGGGGGTVNAAVMDVDVVSTSQTAQTWSNITLAVQELFNTTYSRVKLDLTYATHYRLVANISAVTGTSAPNLDMNLQYSTDDSTYQAADTAGAGEVDINTVGRKVGAWATLVDGAKADVYLRIVGKDGNASRDITFRQIRIQFKMLSTGGEAPANAQYYVAALDGTLSDEIVLSAGEGIDLAAGVISGEDATSANKGIASFSTDNFLVSSGAVTIKDQGVAYAEIQNVSATDKLLGRVSAEAGVVEEITCTDAAQSILDDTTVGAIRTTLGVGTGDSPQFANLVITNGGDIRPSANATTAISIAQADGTDFINFDTTNKRMGIGGDFAPSWDLSFAEGGARTIRVEDNTNSSGNQTGYELVVQAGDASATGEDDSGGTLTLAAGGSVGEAGSSIAFQTTSNGSAGSDPNTPTTKMTLTQAGYLMIGDSGGNGAIVNVVSNDLGATPAITDGIFLENTTDAANGAQQYSPPITLRGEGWQSLTEPVGGKTVSADFRLLTRPIQGTSAITAALDIQKSIEGAAFGNLITILSEGQVGIGTASPGVILDLLSSGTPSMQFKMLNTAASSSSGGGGAVIYSGDSAALASGDRMGYFIFGGSRDASNNLINACGFQGYADGNWADGSSYPSRFQIETCASGATARVATLVIDNAGHVLPYRTAGTQNLGNATYYWADISYKTATDRGCLGSFDAGVELQDGSLVSDIEALEAIKVDPEKETVYGVPRFDYSTMPKAVYKPAPIATKRTIREQDPETGEILSYWEKGEKMGADGAEMTALFSIVIGALKDINTRLKLLEAK